MSDQPSTKLRIGDWLVDPASGQIWRDGAPTRLEARTMRLLLCLAEHPGEVVSIDDLLTKVWAGVIVSPDSVYQAVTSLRRILGDDPKHPAYISTVPRLGYRMVATVGPWEGHATEKESERTVSAEILQATSSRSNGFRWIAGIGLTLALIVVLVLVFQGRFGKNNPPASVSAALPQQSIGVVPFLDLTEGMKEEEFADGMTEELIDKLSKIPGLRVPAPTASFYFKNKQTSIAEIAKSLGVTYILDGSTRKSGDMVRVAARLVRADSNYVIWSDTYDRPFADRVKIQDDIAGEVTKALVAAIHAKPQPPSSSK